MSFFMKSLPLNERIQQVALQQSKYPGHIPVYIQLFETNGTPVGNGILIGSEPKKPILSIFNKFRVRVELNPGESLHYSINDKNVVPSAIIDKLYQTNKDPEDRILYIKAVKIPDKGHC